MVRFFVLEPVDQGSIPTFDAGARIFFDLFQAFGRCLFGGRIFLSNRAHVVTSSNLKMMCQLKKVFLIGF